MRLAIISDLHENADALRLLLPRLAAAAPDRYLLLGDTFDVDERTAEIADLLEPLAPLAVWGNHDFGLCSDPEIARDRGHDDATCRFLHRFTPAVKVAGCHAQHVDAWLDPADAADLWHPGPAPADPALAAPSFAAVPERFILVGHHHRWAVTTPVRPFDWDGAAPLALDPGERHLITIHAARHGHAAILDTIANLLTPITVPADPHYR